MSDDPAKQRARGIKCLLAWLVVFAFWVPNLLRYKRQGIVDVVEFRFSDAEALTIVGVLTAASVTLVAVGFRDLAMARRRANKR